MSIGRFTLESTIAPLAARLDLPSGPPIGFALLAHRFTCSKDHVATARVARGLTARGLGVLRMDFTGLGESGGDLVSFWCSLTTPSASGSCTDYSTTSMPSAPRR